MPDTGDGGVTESQSASAWSPSSTRGGRGAAKSWLDTMWKSDGVGRGLLVLVVKRILVRRCSCQKTRKTPAWRSTDDNRRAFIPDHGGASSSTRRFVSWHAGQTHSR